MHYKIILFITLCFVPLVDRLKNEIVEWSECSKALSSGQKYHNYWVKLCENGLE
jgi:hypothetical protein